MNLGRQSQHHRGNKQGQRQGQKHNQHDYGNSNAASQVNTINKVPFFNIGGISGKRQG